MTSKSSLRAAMLERRRLLDPAAQASLGSVIQKIFLGLDLYAKATSVALYLPVNGEVSTTEVMNHALITGKEVYLPVIEGKEIFLRHCSRPDDLKPGRFGILEPSAGSLAVHPQHIDVFVVPGVVFDLAGNRVGYGKGYFDRLLNSCGKTSELIGFGYDFQLVEAIDAEPHDVRMNMVITERRVISSYC